MLNLFSLLTAEWDPGCFTLISCAAGGAFLAEPCEKQESQRKGFTLLGKGRAGKCRQRGKRQGQSLYARAHESTWSQRGEAWGLGFSAVNGGEEGKVRGKKGSGGVRRRDEDKRGQEGVQIPFRIRSGGSQQSNPITDGGVLCSIC